MVGRPEKRRRRTHVVRYQRKRAASRETNLSHQGAELFGQRTGVVSFASGRLIGISIATHVRNEDRVSCLC